MGRFRLSKKFADNFHFAVQIKTVQMASQKILSHNSYSLLQTGSA